MEFASKELRRLQVIFNLSNISTSVAGYCLKGHDTGSTCYPVEDMRSRVGSLVRRVLPAVSIPSHFYPTKLIHPQACENISYAPNLVNYHSRFLAALKLTLREVTSIQEAKLII